MPRLNSIEVPIDARETPGRRSEGGRDGIAAGHEEAESDDGWNREGVANLLETAVNRKGSSRAEPGESEGLHT
jgi:hypothetical protein